jgi:hypothetical protein
VSAVIPKNCTLGTEYYCVGFGDHAKCKGLPLQVSGVLAAAFTGDQAQSLHPLDRALARIIFRSIEGCLTFGFILQFWHLFWASLFGSPIPLLTSLRVGCSVLCRVPLFIPTIILYVALSKTKVLTFKVERGDVSGHCLGAFCSAIVIISLTLFS